MKSVMLKRSKAVHRRWKIRRIIAEELIQGPNCLIAPSSFRYLEEIFHVDKTPAGFEKPWWSIGVFVENTPNRDADFLTPRVRYACWNRPADFHSQSKQTWPAVKIVQHRLNKSESKTVNELLLQLDKLTRSLEFFATGLADRNHQPDGLADGVGFGDTKFVRWNGYQTFKFSFGDCNVKNNQLKKAVDKLANCLQVFCAKPSNQLFSERYYSNLETLKFGEAWNYKPRC
jgi:hypothetical protein